MGLSLIPHLPRILVARQLTEPQLDIAREIRADTAVPAFSAAEQTVLLRFFSNVDRNTFFIRNLPEEVAATLLAMYSRIRNPRGIRGVFLESLLPKIPVLSQIGCAPEQYLEAVSADKVREFLTTWLDSFGHNSIARMGSVHLCIERVSTLAAKAIEWARPGAGYIELSTRFVDMQRAELYPIWLLAGPHRRAVEAAVNAAFVEYGLQWQGHEQHWGEVFADQLSASAGERKTQLTGKLGDTIGNVLPAAVLTSVGITAMGEAYPSVGKHLLLDGTPECLALAEEIVAEAERAGVEQFLRHYEPSEFDLSHRSEYSQALDFVNDGEYLRGANVRLRSAPTDAEVMDAITGLSTIPWPYLLEAVSERRSVSPHSHDKLPRWFEAATVVFSGAMSFRTWRDLHRQGMSTHLRSFVSPNAPLYIPPDVRDSYVQSVGARLQQLRAVSRDCQRLSTWGPALDQYLSLLGNVVNYRLAHNLRQAEFVGWQRSSWTAHHEVRWHVLQMDEHLTRLYPWWQQVARADRTPDYVFARGQTPHPRTVVLSEQAVPVA